MPVNIYSTAKVSFSKILVLLKLSLCYLIKSNRRMPASVTLKTNSLGNSVSGATLTLNHMPTHFEHRALNTKMSFGSAGFFKHDALLMWAPLWGSWLPPSLQLSTLEGRSRTFKAHNTSQEATRRIHNKQSPVTVGPCSASLHTDYRRPS